MSSYLDDSDSDDSLQSRYPTWVVGEEKDEEALEYIAANALQSLFGRTDEDIMDSLKTSVNLEPRHIIPYRFESTNQGWIVTPKTDELTAQMQAATMDDTHRIMDGSHEIHISQPSQIVELPPEEVLSSVAPITESILVLTTENLPVDGSIPPTASLSSIVLSPPPLPPPPPPPPPSSSSSPPPPQSPRAEIRRDRVAKSGRPYPRAAKVDSDQLKKGKPRIDSETSSDSEYDMEHDLQAEERALGRNVLATMTKRAFLCTLDGCHESFTRRGDLERHLKESKKHAAARVFHCPRCGKKFHRKDALKRHGERRRPCKQKVQKPQSGDALLTPAEFNAA